MASEGYPGEDDEQRYGEDEWGQFRIDDKVWTMNEIRDHPLFMEDMPRDISDNPHLVALQELIYEGQTPEDIVKHFQKLGNEAFRMTPSTPISLQNALLCYTRALEEEDCHEDYSMDQALKSQLYSNRAAVSLRLNEYSKAVNDCRQALRLESGNAKASFRAAKASEALGLTSQALSFCDHALKQMPGEKELRDMQKRLSEQLKREDGTRLEDRKVLAKAKEEKRFADQVATAALERRSVLLGPPMWDTTMYTRGDPPRPRLAVRDSDEAGDGEAVMWPLLMLYDETSQSDFVECFDDRCALEDQLQLMFPADRPVDWDTEGKYTWDRLVPYLECYHPEGKETQMMRLTTDGCLQEQLRGVRVPPCLVLHVFVAKSPAHAHFCKNHDLPSV
jgi:tetratricopeptide (TPR) repeat protein